MNAWVLPYRVQVFETDRAEVARVLALPLALVDLREPLVGVRVFDGDGDPMCDVAIEGCSCASCAELLVCPSALHTVLVAVQQELVKMGARPPEPVGWHLPDGSSTLAELRAPEAVLQ